MAPAAAKARKANVANAAADNDFPGHSAFCLGLLDLVNKKLLQDLPLVIDDDVHLSHLIDEVLFFCKEVLHNAHTTFWKFVTKATPFSE